MNEGKYQYTSHSFEAVLYDYGDSKLSLRVTDFFVTEFNSNSTSLVIERPTYRTVCKFNNPAEVQIFIDDYRHFITAYSYSNTFRDGREFYKVLRFKEFSVTFLSSSKKALFDYSNCITNEGVNLPSGLDYTEVGYMFFNDIGNQQMLIQTAMSRWKDYLESNNLSTSLSLNSVSPNNEQFNFELDFTDLTENGIKVVDQGEFIFEGEQSKVAQISKAFYHTLIEDDSNYVFFGLYNKSFRVEYISSEDLIGFILEKAKEYNASIINKLMISPIADHFIGSDISRGVIVKFELIK